MALEVVVDGLGGIRLVGGPEELFLLRPVLAIQVAEQTPHRDPFHIYTLRLLAAPSAAETIAYELVDGSTYQDSLPCRRPPILLPLSGGFVLGKVEENPLFTTYRVDGIDLWDTKGDWMLRISGSGSYRSGGEVALVQEMRLEVTVEQGETTRSGVLLANLELAPRAELPDISIQLEHQDPFPRYSIRLAAADADGSGARALSDAVFILAHLFRGGEAPPAPGPADCGPAPVSLSGCARHPPCPASGL